MAAGKTEKKKKLKRRSDRFFFFRLGKQKPNTSGYTKNKGASTRVHFGL